MSDAPPPSIYTGKSAPPIRGGGSCCGGNDCAPLRIEPGVIEGVEDGYRIRLSVKQAQAINPARQTTADFIVPWGEVQASWDDQWHLCIPDGVAGTGLERQPEFYCFWAPPNT